MTVSKPVGLLVDPLLYYTFRVTIVASGGTNIIKCYIDGVELIDATDSTFTSGEAGILHGAGGTVEVDEVEVLGLPVESDFVDINS